MIVDDTQSVTLELWQKSCRIICDPRTTILNVIISFRPRLRGEN